MRPSFQFSKRRSARRYVGSVSCASLCFCASLCLSAVTWATTVQQLSTDEMIQKSAVVVRGTVLGVSSAMKGSDIVTVYQLKVTEGLKGAQAGQQVELSVPGGVARGMRQVVAGAPTFEVGGDYVVFLWKGGNGAFQVIGLSQGMFAVRPDTSGVTMLVRPAVMETVVDKSGQVVRDQASSMKLDDLRARVQSLAGGQ